jgi:DNA-binding response OmpR family regulator
MHILLVEDDQQLADALCKALRQQDYAVDWVADGAIADNLLKTEHFDLIILDLGVPKLEGLEILKRLRHRGTRTPVLILTARGTLENRVAGLDLGADDYLSKPFELPELEARVRALLRRNSSAASAVIQFGTLIFDSVARRASLQGETLELPRRELCLLEILLHRAGQVVSKEQIAAQLFDFDDDASPNAIELYVHRLRKKLAPAGLNIRTIRGLGYLLEA